LSTQPSFGPGDLPITQISVTPDDKIYLSQISTDLSIEEYLRQGSTAKSLSSQSGECPAGTYNALMEQYTAASYQSLPEQIETEVLDGENVYISFMTGGSVSLKGGYNADIDGPQEFKKLADAIRQAAEEAGLTP
jgi:hypothetical protein